jgi:hypothetical protein
MQKGDRSMPSEADKRLVRFAELLVAKVASYGEDQRDTRPSDEAHEPDDRTGEEGGHGEGDE